MTSAPSAPPREALIAAARSYLGVKWRHLGRSRRGLDCVGLALVAAQDVGLYRDLTVTGYARLPDGHSLHRALERHLDRVPMAEMAAGDLLTFTGWPRRPYHLALVTEAGPNPAIIHCYAEVGKVVEHGLSAFSQKPVGCWRIDFARAKAGGHPLPRPTTPRVRRAGPPSSVRDPLTPEVPTSEGGNGVVGRGLDHASMGPARPLPTDN